jgi:hypothetical protein
MVVLVAEPQLAPFRVDVAVLQVQDQVGGVKEKVVHHQPFDDLFPEVVTVCGARRVKMQWRPHHGLELAASSAVLVPMHLLAIAAAVVGCPAPRALPAAVIDTTRCVLALPETGIPTGRQRGMHFMMAS